MVDLLRLVDPNIQRLQIVAEADRASVYVDTGLPELLPLAMSGEGAVRVFSIAVNLIDAKGGVLLVDEIDNGLHYSVMRPFWIAIRELCERYDVQLLATTHNDELIRYAIDAFALDYADFEVMRIDRDGEAVRAAAYTDEMLTAVAETGWEVRG